MPLQNLCLTKWTTIRPNDIPWFNTNLRQLIRKRNRIHKLAKTVNNEQVWYKFRKFAMR